MKILVPIFLVLMIVGGVLYFKASQEAPGTQPNTEVPEPEGKAVAKDFEGTFVFDTEKSFATWTGSKKVIKDYYDSGTIDIKSGFVVFEKGDITSGEVVFDMTTLAAAHTGRGEGEDKLTSHLKSADFFEVEKYPEAKYVVSGAEKTKDGYTLIGELTLKGETHSLSVPVKTAMESGNAMIAGIADVNRATWNVRFGSESFFDNLGDNVINDIFTLEFEVVARP